MGTAELGGAWEGGADVPPCYKGARLCFGASQPLPLPSLCDMSEAESMFLSPLCLAEPNEASPGPRG